MTMQNFPTKGQIEAADVLTFPDRAAQSEKMANIQIQVSPAGTTVVIEYTGAVSSIAAAIERLQKAGIMDLVKPAAPAPIATSTRRSRVERVTPIYRPDGTPVCPAHPHKALQESQHGGLYCTARAKPGEPANPKGYCPLVFES